MIWTTPAGRTYTTEATTCYYSWWEMYPSNAIQVAGQPVSPGDSIRASVVKSGSRYTLKVTDSTHSANSFTTTQTCSSCADSSAEWIAEAPSGVYPLSDFRSWSTSGASVTSGSASGVISSFPDDELTMIDSSGAVKAQPGSLSGAAVSPSPGSAARNRVARVPLAGGTGCSGSSRPEAKPWQPVSPPIHGSPVWHRRWSRPLNEASCRTITGICRA